MNIPIEKIIVEIVPTPWDAIHNISAVLSAVLNDIADVSAATDINPSSTSYAGILVIKKNIAIFA